MPIFLGASLSFSHSLFLLVSQPFWLKAIVVRTSIEAVVVSSFQRFVLHFASCRWLVAAE